VPGISAPFATPGNGSVSAFALDEIKDSDKAISKTLTTLLFSSNLMCLVSSFVSNYQNKSYLPTIFTAHTLIARVTPGDTAATHLKSIKIKGFNIR
jgi:hypothetical protein